MVSTLVVINGPASSGKSTLCQAVQSVAEEPWLHAGVDRFWGALPDRFMQAGPRAAEGLSWIRGIDEGGRPVVRTVPGWLVQRAAVGMHRAVVALVGAGCNVVCDDLILDPAWADDWAVATEGIRAFLVGLECPLGVLEHRELARGDREPGEARAEAEAVHHGIAYDLSFDTATNSPENMALQILEMAAAGAPSALPHRLGALRRGERR